MTRTALSPRGLKAGFGLLLLASLSQPANAEPLTPPDLERDPLLSPQATVSPSGGQSANLPTNRLRLFRIQPGFLSDPLGLDQDDRAQPDPDGGPDYVNVAFGNDNPYFDFRRQGDPGGVGYTRVNTQVQLLGNGSTSLAVAVQAVTPAGLAFDGLPDRMGSTVLTPALSLFHALDDFTAVQAFVGKNVPIQNSSAQSVTRDFQYGMAVQRPVSTQIDDPFRYLYLSVGALGQYRADRDGRPPVVMEVLPGLHYKVADNWWISGGVSVPVGQARPELQQWQVTCSVQF
jgi:hypothetical protein